MRLLIFTYAPAGLGHLRVTDALAEAKPEDSAYVILGSMDRFVTWIHRFTSINPFGKYLFLKSQYGVFEDIFTWIYSRFLVLTSGGVYRELKNIIDQNLRAEDIWVIATHFGMAHQIGAVKEKLMKETGKEIRLIVQVTDDTSQHIWCVKGADLTFVPSLFVKQNFENYAKSRKIEFTAEVIPYPLDNSLTKKLPKQRSSRQKVFIEKTGKVKIAIPISGAAVGLSYFSDLVTELLRLSYRFEFWILVKKTPFTELFIAKMSNMSGVNLMVGKNDIEMIELYELLYENNLIHIEITKPSEQAFKAILYPTANGGSIMLFTAPIGRQEEDNIKFLERHGLLSTDDERTVPRGIRIPSNPKEAAKLVNDSTKSGLFRRMTSPNFRFSKKSLASGEVGPDGARLFWKKAQKHFGK